MKNIFLFALFFETIEPLYSAARGPENQTLSELTTLPSWSIVLALFIMAVIGFIVANKVERKGNGVITSEELEKE